MSKRKRIPKSEIEAVRRLLLTEWNPIGSFVPNDEYDSYIPSIRRLMQDRAGVNGLAEHLTKLERVSMGLTPNPENNERVAKLLLELIE